MKENVESGSLADQKMGNELLQMLIDKISSNEKTTNPILQEIGVRISAQEKKMEELKGELEQVESGVTNMSEKIVIPTGPITKLSADLKAHTDFFLLPRKKEVHHRHLLGKPLLTLGVAIVVIGLLATLLVRAYGRAEEYSTADIKWRYVKLLSDSVLFIALRRTEESYKSDPDQFRRVVVDEEDRRQELFKKWNQQNKTQSEIWELEARKKFQ